MPKPKPEVMDRESVLKDRLKRAQGSLTKYAAGLEETKTLATDLMKIRDLRLTIDDCKRSLSA